MKSLIKSFVLGTLLAPIKLVQGVAGALGIKYFFQGDIFDRLLETRTSARLRDGRKLTFHTPNSLTRFRADTLLTKEPETLDWIEGFAEGSVFWDVGANVGVYSLYAAKARSCCVYSFEPSIENTYLLNRNIAENGLEEKIFAFPFALSDTNGPNLFQHTKIQLGGALNSFGADYSYDGKPAAFIHKYRVFGFRADDIPSLFHIPIPNHLKIDVDGIEHLIARGARTILSNPELKSVLIELNLKFPEQRDEILKIFQECGLYLREYERAAAFYGDDSFSGIFNHIFTRERTAS